jgi:hypothetical protein
MSQYILDSSCGQADWDILSTRKSSASTGDGGTRWGAQASMVRLLRLRVAVP